MAAAKQWHWKMAVLQWGWEVVLGGGLRLQQQHWAVAVAEEHVTMALVSASSKLGAYFYDVGISVGKNRKRGCVQCKGRTLTAMARR